jgi:hypothetical protein
MPLWSPRMDLHIAVLDDCFATVTRVACMLHSRDLPAVGSDLRTHKGISPRNGTLPPSCAGYHA